MRRGKRVTRGHLLLEALVGGGLILLVLAGLASSELASRRVLDRGIDDVELARVASERLEFLRAAEPTSAAWTAPSAGTVPGRPGWTWSIAPAAFTDSAVSGLSVAPSLRRARVTVTAADGRAVTVEALRW
jgi:hypothetical protein